jgi:hypothetical protein
MKISLISLCLITILFCSGFNNAYAQRAGLIANDVEVARQKALTSAMRVHATQQKRDNATILRTTGISKECNLNIGVADEVKNRNNSLGNQRWRSRQGTIVLNEPTTVYCP